MSQPIPIWLFHPEYNMYFMQWYVPMEYVVQEETPQESKKKKDKKTAKQDDVDQEEKRVRYEAAKQRMAAARKIARQETERLRKLRASEAEKIREKTMRDLKTCQREARVKIALNAGKIFKTMVEEAEGKNKLMEKINYGHKQVGDKNDETTEQ